MEKEKDNDNGKTQPIIPGDTNWRAIRGDLQQAQKSLVPISRQNTGMAVSHLFMGTLIHHQLLGEGILLYQRCITCGVYSDDQIQIDILDTCEGNPPMKVVAVARLCIACWKEHQNILKHCIHIHEGK